jgi:Ras-related protein Rab-23
MKLVSVSLRNITATFCPLNFRIDGEDVRLMLWDTAGQEEFDAITAAYYRGAHACVLAFSATDRDSFDAITSWKLKVRPLLLQWRTPLRGF